MVAVATTLVTKAAEGLTEAGKEAFAALARLVRRKLNDDPDALSALGHTADQTDEGVRTQRLGEALERIATRDPAFADELARLWSGMRGEGVTAADSGVVNQISGAVSGTVVQARDVHGGISFGSGPG